MYQGAISRKVGWLAAVTVAAVAATAFLAYLLTDAGATHERSKARAAGDAILDAKLDVGAAKTATAKALSTVTTEAAAGSLGDGSDDIDVTDDVDVPAAIAQDATTIGIDAAALVTALTTQHFEAGQRLAKARTVQGKVRSDVDKAATAVAQAKTTVDAAVAGTGGLPLTTDTTSGSEGEGARDDINTLATVADTTNTAAKLTKTRVAELTSTATAAQTAASRALTKARQLAIQVDAYNRDGATETAQASAVRQARTIVNDLRGLIETANNRAGEANASRTNLNTAATNADTAVGIATTEGSLEHARATAYAAYGTDPWVKASNNAHPHTTTNSAAAASARRGRGRGRGAAAGRTGRGDPDRPHRWGQRGPARVLVAGSLRQRVLPPLHRHRPVLRPPHGRPGRPSRRQRAILGANHGAVGGHLLVEGRDAHPLPGPVLPAHDEQPGLVHRARRRQR